MKRDVIFATGILFLSAGTSCTSDDYEGDSDGQAVLATIETDDNFTIEFARLPDGGVVVSEVGPGTSQSMLSHFAAQQATPLEIYLAVASGDADVPLALEAHHAAITDEEPRDLSLSFFRHSYSGGVSSATCTYAVDYDWFDEMFDGTGWTQSDYQSVYDLDSTVDLTSQHLITHVCNYWANFGNEPVKLYVLIGYQSWYWLSGIDVGERGVIYVLGSGTEHWYSYATLPWDGEDPIPPQRNTLRHGIMAP